MGASAETGDPDSDSSRKKVHVGNQHKDPR